MLQPRGADGPFERGVEAAQSRSLKRTRVRLITVFCMIYILVAGGSFGLEDMASRCGRIFGGPALPSGRAGDEELRLLAADASGRYVDVGD